MVYTIATGLLTHEQLNDISGELSAFVNAVAAVDRPAGFNRRFGERDSTPDVCEIQRADMPTCTRSINGRIEELVAPVWAHLSKFEALNAQVQARPQALTGAGAGLLPRIAQITLLERGDVMAAALITWAVDQHAAARNIHWWNRDSIDAIGWLGDPDWNEGLKAALTDRTIDVATELHKRQLFGFLMYCRGRLRQQRQREFLAGSGIRLGQIGQGEIRKMDHETISDVGEYLRRFDDVDYYGRNPRAQPRAGVLYLCVYGDQSLPVVLVEVYPHDLHIGGVFHPDREDCREVLQQLRAWLASEGRQALRAPEQQASHRPLKPQQV